MILGRFVTKINFFCEILAIHIALWKVEFAEILSLNSAGWIY